MWNRRENFESDLRDFFSLSMIRNFQFRWEKWRFQRGGGHYLTQAFESVLCVCYCIICYLLRSRFGHVTVNPDGDIRTDKDSFVESHHLISVLVLHRIRTTSWTTRPTSCWEPNSNREYKQTRPSSCCALEDSSWAILQVQLRVESQ